MDSDGHVWSKKNCHGEWFKSVYYAFPEDTRERIDAAKLTRRDNLNALCALPFPAALLVESIHLKFNGITSVRACNAWCTAYVRTRMALDAHVDRWRRTVAAHAQLPAVLAHLVVGYTRTAETRALLTNRIIVPWDSYDDAPGVWSTFRDESPCAPYGPYGQPRGKWQTETQTQTEATESAQRTHEQRMREQCNKQCQTQMKRQQRQRHQRLHGRQFTQRVRQPSSRKNRRRNC
jgi:hypothetical protein